MGRGLRDFLVVPLLNTPVKLPEQPARTTYQHGSLGRTVGQDRRALQGNLGISAEVLMEGRKSLRKQEWTDRTGRDGMLHPAPVKWIYDSSLLSVL